MRWVNCFECVVVKVADKTMLRHTSTGKYPEFKNTSTGDYNVYAAAWRLKCAKGMPTYFSKRLWVFCQNWKCLKGFRIVVKVRWVHTCADTHIYMLIRLWTPLCVYLLLLRTPYFESWASTAKDSTSEINSNLTYFLVCQKGRLRSKTCEILMIFPLRFTSASYFTVLLRNFEVRCHLLTYWIFMLFWAPLNNMPRIPCLRSKLQPSNNIACGEFLSKLWLP